jgi:ArsR family transcriptional regulator, virulence genes transcriptional regulator
MDVLSGSALKNLTSILKSIAHPIRLKIICLLGEHKFLSVTEITRKTRCEQSLVSHHLTTLRAKGVLTLERSGKNVFYRLTHRKILGIVKCIESCNYQPCRK